MTLVACKQLVKRLLPYDESPLTASTLLDKGCDVYMNEKWLTQRTSRCSLCAARLGIEQQTLQDV